MPDPDKENAKGLCQRALLDMGMEYWWDGQELHFRPLRKPVDNPEDDWEDEFGGSLGRIMFGMDKLFFITIGHKENSFVVLYNKLDVDLIKEIIEKARSYGK